MLREIVLDTETTGLDARKGDRLIEIGCIELVNRISSGREYHCFINPDGRQVHPDAEQIHGISNDFLEDKPTFDVVVDEFLAFLGEDGHLVIHNASFDMMFINAELKWMGKPPLPMTQAVDTLDIARRKFPGAQASLDALCKRFGVDNSAREKHGALLDSEILAEVYLELLGGRQQGLVLDPRSVASDGGQTADAWTAPARPSPLPPRLTDLERDAHTAFIDEIGDGAIWRQ